MKKKIILLLCLIQAFVICNGQQYYFQNFQADDGLLHNNVTCIVQDNRGFIWVGTRGGLNRFDGYSFKDFLITQKRSSVNYISALAEDKRGNIWIGTLSGLFNYNPVRDTITELKMSSVPSIYDLKIDQDNNLWILSERRIYKYSISENKLSILDKRGFAIGIDTRQKALWIGAEDRNLTRYDIRTGKLTEINVRAQGLIPRFADVTRVQPAGNRVLIGTTQGLFSYDILTGKCSVLLSKNADGTEIYIRDIKIAPDGKYWLATESGIYIYNPKKSDVINLKKRTGDAYSITDNAVYALCHDNRGGVWAGTFFGGLNYRSLQNNQFEKYFPLNAANSISGNAVREICEDDDNNIWIGTEDAGINKLDVASGKFSHFTTGRASANLSYPNIHGLLVSGDKLFAGPFMHGLEVVDLSSGKVTERYPNLQSGHSRSNTFAMSIFKTSAGKILVGSTGTGLSYYDPLGKKLTLINQIPDNSFAFDIEEDHTGTIWTGSMANGTFFFNPKTGVHGNIRFNKKDGANSDNAIQGIYEDSKQALWLSTDGGGLIRLNKDRKTFKRLTTENGFPTDNIFRTLEDSSGNLWISTLKGLVCFNLNTEKFHIYNKSNGLLTDQFNYNSAFKARDGKMYFGSVKGMIAFRPEDLKKKTQVPPIYITAFEVNGSAPLTNGNGPLSGKSPGFRDSVELAYDQSTFDVEFAALDYSASDAIHYKYRMDGLSNGWTYLNSNRKAYFTDLSPGEYKFVVQAESNIDLWKTPQRTLYIKINPPFWKSTIAYIFYISFFCMAGYLFVRTYHQTVNRKNQRKLKLFQLEKEKEVYHAKIEFFTNIAHEIQTPLTLIKGPIDWALDKIDDATVVRRNLKLVKKNIGRLLSLTSQLLDFRKTEMDQFGLNFVSADINQLVKDRLAAFKPHITERQLDISLNLLQKPIKAYVDKEAFTKILGNLISNAIKYSEKVIVICMLIPESYPDKFRLIIENDGPIIPEQHKQKIFEPFYRVRNENNTKGTGIGLSLAKSLTELHQGSLLLLSNPKLNIFELTLPIHQEIEFELKRLKN